MKGKKVNQEVNLYERYDQETLKPFQATLLAKRVEVMARLQRNGEPVFVEELNGAERKDKPQVVEKHAAEKSKNEKELADIEEALKKIEDGSYGLCDGCQKRILLARLEACPTAESCVPCYAAKKIRDNPRVLKKY